MRDLKALICDLRSDVSRSARRTYLITGVIVDRHSYRSEESQAKDAPPSTSATLPLAYWKSVNQRCWLRTSYTAAATSRPCRVSGTRKGERTSNRPWSWTRCTWTCAAGPT